MPKLLAFVPCEKIILDKDNNLSLISILSEIHVPVPVDPVPPNASLALQWDIVTLWCRGEGEEEGHPFEQRSELLSPTGRVLVTTSIPFKMTRPIHRNMAHVYGLPVGEFGQHTLRLTLRDVQAGTEEIAAEYPLSILRDSAITGVAISGV